MSEDKVGATASGAGEAAEQASVSLEEMNHEGDVLQERNDDEVVVRKAIPSAGLSTFHDQDGNWYRIGGEKNRFDMWFGAKGARTAKQAWARARIAPTVVAYEAERAKLSKPQPAQGEAKPQPRVTLRGFREVSKEEYDANPSPEQKERCEHEWGIQRICKKCGVFGELPSVQERPELPPRPKSFKITDEQTWQSHHVFPRKETKAYMDALEAELAKVREEQERLEVQLAGCGVAATGWATEDNRAQHGDYGWSPAFEDIMKLREHSWRCFHCGFFTLDEKNAAAHFGDRDDAEEFKPLCKWMDRTPVAEQAFLLQDAIRDLNDERDENMRLIDRAERAEAELAALRASTTKSDDKPEYDTPPWQNHIYDHTNPKTNAMLCAERGYDVKVDGTFDCPICGSNEIHNHSSEEIAAHRSKPKLSPTPGTEPAGQPAYHELFERSKDDRAMIAGSEVRQVIGDLRAALETIARLEGEKR